MKSAPRGTPISGVEVANVSANGVWLLLDQREFFLAFEDFPWFEHATIRQITGVKRPSPHHLYWPDLDIDLAVDSLVHPEAYPLVSKARIDERVLVRERERGARGRSSPGKGARGRPTARG
jgi:hypothetical protein